MSHDSRACLRAMRVKRYRHVSPGRRCKDAFGGSWSGATWPPAMMTLPLGRISGRALSALVTAVRKTPARVPLTRLLRGQLGIDALRALPPDDRGTLPFSHAPLRGRSDIQRPSAELPLALPGSWPRSVANLAEYYRDGRANPVDVVTRSLTHARHLAGRVPTLGPLCGYDDERALQAAHAVNSRACRSRSRRRSIRAASSRAWAPIVCVVRRRVAMRSQSRACARRAPS